MDSTEEEIIQALINKFPLGKEFITTISANYARTSGSTEYVPDITKATTNGHGNLIACISSYGYGLNNGWTQTVTTNKVNITDYSSLLVKGLIYLQVYPENSSNGSCHIYLCNDSGTNVRTIASVNGSSGTTTVNNDVNIEDLKGDHFIKIVNSEVGNLIQASISSAYLS